MRIITFIAQPSVIDQMFTHFRTRAATACLSEPSVAIRLRCLELVRRVLPSVQNREHLDARVLRSIEHTMGIHDHFADAEVVALGGEPLQPLPGRDPLAATPPRLPPRHGSRLGCGRADIEISDFPAARAGPSPLRLPNRYRCRPSARRRRRRGWMSANWRRASPGFATAEASTRSLTAARRTSANPRGRSTSPIFLSPQSQCACPLQRCVSRRYLA